MMQRLSGIDVQRKFVESLKTVEADGHVLKIQPLSRRLISL